VLQRIEALAKAAAPGDWYPPAQRLSRADALRAATIEGAYLTFEEDQKGSIEPAASSPISSCCLTIR
jgi:predicted amidohydrolase YtcJ